MHGTAGGGKRFGSRRRLRRGIRNLHVLVQLEAIQRPAVKRFDVARYAVIVEEILQTCYSAQQKRKKQADRVGILDQRSRSLDIAQIASMAVAEWQGHAGHNIRRVDLSIDGKSVV